MKMVKSLLLGSAAGLVAVAGAQAADLPVKAKPVQYVKICTLYGEGFYYIPGTDTCIKLGGYVRADYGYNVKGARTPAYSGTQGAQDRTVSQYSTRHRAHWDVDVRTQTAYGTLRTFTAMHFQNEDGGDTLNVQRAFIQWAGFTFGHAQSFQDTWAINDSYHYAQQQNNSDTGANGVNQIAYTWELGNGMALTVGADEVRRKSLTNLSIKTALQVGREPTSNFAGQRWPDAHIDFRVDQAWGYWASSVVAHDVSATYYTSVPGVCTGTVTTCGHPDDEVGFAVQTGAEFKLGFIAPGDRGGFGVRYAQGASGFGGGSNMNSLGLFGNSDPITGTLGSVAYGPQTDGVFINGSDIELTTTWTVQAAFEHYWTPALKTSISGAYTRVMYNDTAKGFFLTNVCPAGQTNFAGITPAQCDPDWSFFQGGIRTQWNVTRGFYLGVDVFYVRAFTAFKGATVALGPNPIIGARPSGAYILDDNDSVGAIFRAQSQW
jgi:hypothetical protein